MTKNINRPVLYKGESYNAPVTKKRPFIPQEPSVPFEIAREKLSEDITIVREKIHQLGSDKKLPNETVLCFRIRSEFAAKSYYPKDLFFPTKASSDLQEIGSRMYKYSPTTGLKEDQIFTSGKIFFVRTTQLGLDEFEKKLNLSAARLADSFRWDIQRLEGLDLLKAEEQVVGFDHWQEGRVEAILHPFSIDRSIAITKFKELLDAHGVKWHDVRIKQYGVDGLTFISMPGNNKVLSALSDFNPLRTIHPLHCRNFSIPIRFQSGIGSPLPPIYTKKVRPIVGVLDGGYVSGNKSLDSYVEVVDYVGGSAFKNGPAHGTAVTSALLYGALNSIRNNERLHEPTITVKNFKVLSTNSNDADLYEVIDAIEEIVPANPDIQVYNLSLGPDGPILDDTVSRFTFACDTLSKSHNVLFCTAIGNDGEIIGYDRIQSPSDMVNGLAFGAYTISAGGDYIRAPYSCKGPGREGNKMKPDLLAFGGCELVPIQLVAAQDDQRTYTSGTSFSTPIGASAVARLLAGSGYVLNPLTGRALLLHAASCNEKTHSAEMGHGILPNDVEEILTCEDKVYTLIYEGEIGRGSYRKFDIPWPADLEKGKVKFRWTVAVLAAVDSNAPEDYTTASVEVSICCNLDKFQFSKVINGKRQSKQVDVLKDSILADTLLAQGWTKSNNPISEGGPSPFATEADLKQELKWDSIDGRRLTKMANGIKGPSLYVHAIGRGHRFDNDKIRFAIILSVNAESAPFDIYSKIIANYTALVPIKIKSEAIVSVNA